MLLRSFGFMLFALALVLVVQRTFLLGSADSTVGSKEASREKSFRRRSETSRSTSESPRTDGDKLEHNESFAMEAGHNFRVSDSSTETSIDHFDDLFIAEVSDPNYELFKKNLHKLREEGIDSLREAIRNLSLIHI